jgi:hypothetical protein
MLESIPLWAVYLAIFGLIITDLIVSAGLILMVALFIGLLSGKIAYGLIVKTIEKGINILLCWVEDALECSSLKDFSLVFVPGVAIIKIIYSVLNGVQSIIELILGLGLLVAGTAFFFIGIAALIVVNIALFLLLNTYIV